MKHEEYLQDVDMCIKLLMSLKNNYISPVSLSMINSEKVKRIRLIINDVLKKY